MPVHLLNALETLKGGLNRLAARSESQVISAIEALLEEDVELAKQVISEDSEIDELEVELEEACLQTLALYQPVATDLRFIIAVLKANNDLERIADLASNIAERAIELAGESRPEQPIDFADQAGRVKEILRNCLNAFMQRDPELAREVLRADAEINRLHSENYGRIEKVILSHPAHANSFIRLLSISRYLERIGDLAKNIAEDVIYLVEGRIIRHEQN